MKTTRVNIRSVYNPIYDNIKLRRSCYQAPSGKNENYRNMIKPKQMDTGECGYRYMSEHAHIER